ncbi:MAG: N-acetylglucosamine-6-phosphate deacetylase, partial [Bacillota bacterium]|nr:N-acetylglucosamine-6-phosphate deacetylase [Bacillota bacterium]
MSKILFKNCKIIIENEILEGQSLIVDNGKISEILNCEADLSFTKIIDCENKYLSPGFIDLHNHGNSGFDAMDGTKEALEKIAKFHITNGVTSYLATTMTASSENTVNAIKNVVSYLEKDIDSDEAELLGLYLEGPYFAMEKKGAQPGQYIKEGSIAEVKEYIKAGNGFIKIIALAPEIENANEITRYLVNNGITVSCGHTNATYDEAMITINNGASEATHIFNGMRAFSHREPGIVGACLLDQRVSCEMICDGIHLHSGAMEIVYRMKGKENIVLISDAMRATGLEDGEYDLGGQTVYVNGYEARLGDGVLAGSTLTLNRAVKNMIELVDVPLQEAVLMATLNPAKKIGVEKTKGSIAIGKDADLIIFDADINIEKAFLKGKEFVI